MLGDRCSGRQSCSCTTPGGAHGCPSDAPCQPTTVPGGEEPLVCQASIWARILGWSSAMVFMDEMSLRTGCVG